MKYWKVKRFVRLRTVSCERVSSGSWEQKLLLNFNWIDLSWSENIFASFTGSQCAWEMSMSMVVSPLKEPAQSELWASYNSSSPPFFTTSAPRCRIMGWYRCDQPSCVIQFKEFSFHPRIINQNIIYVSRGEIITMAGSFFNWNVICSPSF